MKKVISTLLTILLLFGTLFIYPASSASSALPESLYFRDVFQFPDCLIDGYHVTSGVRIELPHHPHESFGAQNEQLTEILTLFNDSVIEVVENIELNQDEKISLIHYDNFKTTFHLDVYRNGCFTIDGNDTVYRFIDFNPIENALDRTVTMRKIWSQAFPAKNQMTDWSPWTASCIRGKEHFNDLIPSYAHWGYFYDKCSREFFCDVVALLVAKSPKSDKIVNEDVTFSDTENESIFYLAKRGIIEGKGKTVYYGKRGAAVGKGETKVSPNAVLTREEAATVIRRVLDYLEVDLSETEKTDYTFSDDEDISVWAKSAVYDLYAEELMFGVDDDRFAPKNKLTKEQAIILAYRVYEKYVLQFDEANSESGVLDSDDSYQG